MSIFAVGQTHAVMARNEGETPRRRSPLEAAFFGLFVISSIIGCTALLMGVLSWVFSGQVLGPLFGMAGLFAAPAIGCLLISRLARG